MLFWILLERIAMMALLAAVGVYLSRKGLLSAQGSKDLGNILLRIIIPCLIVKSYITEYSRERLLELALSAGLALMGYLLSMAIAYAVYGKRRRLENFAAAFCNAGFIGIPLAQAVVGSEGVFYAAAAVALLNLFQWTYGVYIMTGRKDAISLKTIAKNPVVLSIVIGVSLFLCRVPVPGLISDTLGAIAGMNTPIAMILMGTYLAKLPLRKLLDRRAFGCVLLRLVVIPAVLLAIFCLLPLGGNLPLAMAVFLTAATPVGANICIFAQQYNCDYEFSVVTVCLSTVLSVVTVPLLASLAQIIL
ncbi:AEC family transporter [Oscillibacter sp.]|uniref:AEC family transporter n=1 Tax=Oscillibacter sp. TaxID=1945593 RepID=UPI002612317F|nr:AEC family transporter [Oscillibacter sp.]MDD3347888.1 AEC family transporter [Oscillibacter sp.]